MNIKPVGEHAWFKIYKLLSESKKPMTVDQIHEKTGMPYPTIRKELAGLVKIDRIDRIPYTYKLKESKK